MPSPTPATVAEAQGVSPTLRRILGGLGGNTDYSEDGSYQPVSADFTLGAAAGGGHLAAVMGNLLDDGAALTNAADSILAGVIGKYSITNGTNTTYQECAVAAGIADGVSDTHVNAVVAYIDGDSATTIANAAFKVMNNNSTAASGFHFGVDLQDASHDGYAAVDKDFYLSAPIRITNDLCVLTGTATPTDGSSGTGAGVAEKGSLHLNTSDGKLRTNTNTKASPTWTVVGTQS